MAKIDATLIHGLIPETQRRYANSINDADIYVFSYQGGNNPVNDDARVISVFDSGGLAGYDGNMMVS